MPNCGRVTNRWSGRTRALHDTYQPRLWTSLLRSFINNMISCHTTLWSGKSRPGRNSLCGGPAAVPGVDILELGVILLYLTGLTVSAWCNRLNSGFLRVAENGRACQEEVWSVTICSCSEGCRSSSDSATDSPLRYIDAWSVFNVARIFMPCVRGRCLLDFPLPLHDVVCRPHPHADLHEGKSTGDDNYR